jgi:hypothetical protein
LPGGTEPLRTAVVRSRVKLDNRTRVLLVIALIVSGVIAFQEMRGRDAQRAARPSARPAPAASDGIIEVELETAPPQGSTR